MIKMYIAALAAVGMLLFGSGTTVYAASMDSKAVESEAIVESIAQENTSDLMTNSYSVMTQLVNETKEAIAEDILSQVAAVISPTEFKSAGVFNWNGWRWTWYSERVLPGGGLNIPGRHTDSDGFVCDEDGYICLASGSLAKGTVVDTPFGREGKVYDSGCAANTLDVYVNW